jgi:hypothetical protein
MTDDGYVDGWAERIILGSTRFDDYEDISTDDSSGGTPQTPEIKVEIKRRG